MQFGQASISLGMNFRSHLQHFQKSYWTRVTNILNRGRIKLIEQLLRVGEFLRMTYGNKAVYNLIRVYVVFAN
jgi:hypothetical protein